MKRATAAELGRQTVRILEAGRYTSPLGAVVEIVDLVQRAVSNTCSYPPDVSPPWISPGEKETRVEVKNESTLAAARRLVEEGYRSVALNFASAKHPGGGFRGGARAQEESLARGSGLYACLKGHPMYAFHQARADAMYTDYAIYSPDVPVLRDNEGTLLDQPYRCSFITAPAVNAKVVLHRSRERCAEVRDTMNRRIQKVLAIAAAHGHVALVLGAWGCGIFRNNCHAVAEGFQQALQGQFQGVFERVVFAVLDPSEECRFIGPFERLFASECG